MKFITSLLLALLVGVGFAATTTTYDLSVSDSSKVNKVQTAATLDATENIVVITIGTKPRTVQFVSDKAWYYRSTASGQNFPVAAGQTLTLNCTTTTTFYFVRQSADGTLYALVTG